MEIFGSDDYEPSFSEEPILSYTIKFDNDDLSLSVPDIKNQDEQDCPGKAIDDYLEIVTTFNDTDFIEFSSSNKAFQYSKDREFRNEGVFEIIL